MEDKKDNSELQKVDVQFVNPPTPNEPQPGTSNSDPTVRVFDNVNNVLDQLIRDLGIPPLSAPVPPHVPPPNASSMDLARLPQQNSLERVVESTSQPLVEAEDKPNCAHYDHFFFQRYNQLDTERKELAGKCETLQLKLHKSQDENKRVKAKLANVMEQIGEVHERQNRSLEEMIKSALAERLTPITESTSVTSEIVTQNGERITADSTARAARMNRLQEWLFFEFTSTKDDVKKQNVEINKVVEQLRNIDNKLEELTRLSTGPIMEFMVTGRENQQNDVNGAANTNNESATGGQRSNEGYTPDDGQLPGPSSACVMGNLALRTEEEGLPANENNETAVTSSLPATTSGGSGENSSNNSASARDPPEEMDQDEIQIIAELQGCRFCYQQHRQENRERMTMKTETGSGEVGVSDEGFDSNGGEESEAGGSEEPEEPPHMRTRAETRWLRIQAALAANNSSNTSPVAAVNSNSNQEETQQEGGQQRVRRSAAILARVRMGRIAKSKRGN